MNILETQNCSLVKSYVSIIEPKKHLVLNPLLKPMCGDQPLIISQDQTMMRGIPTLSIINLEIGLRYISQDLNK